MGTPESKRTKSEAKEALARRRAAAEARANETIETLNALASAHRHRLALDTLERVLILGRTIRLETLSHVLHPHVWMVSEEGWILGHVLTVDPSILESAADITVLTLPDALGEPWGNVEERGIWGRAYAAALRALADAVDEHTRATELAEALRRSLGGL